MEKNLTDNYEKQIYIGRDLFLRYDQDMLIKKYKLKNDHAYLYLNYIGTEYRVSRSDGSIEYMAEGIWKLCKEYTIVITTCSATQKIKRCLHLQDSGSL